MGLVSCVLRPHTTHSSVSSSSPKKIRLACLPMDRTNDIIHWQSKAINDTERKSSHFISTNSIDRKSTGLHLLSWSSLKDTKSNLLRWSSSRSVGCGWRELSHRKLTMNGIHFSLPNYTKTLKRRSTKSINQKPGLKTLITQLQKPIVPGALDTTFFRFVLEKSSYNEFYHSSCSRNNIFFDWWWKNRLVTNYICKRLIFEHCCCE